MSSAQPLVRVALTGAAGFLGRTLAADLSEHFPLRLMDVVPFEGKGESRVGDVTQLEEAMALCEGCSHLVISHMAPRKPGVYDTPTLPFDINVKGTAHLLHAAAMQGVTRVVIISSIMVVQKHRKDQVFLTRGLPASPLGMYALTKAFQEQLAAFYHQTHGLEVALMRPAYVCDEDSLADKYGRSCSTVNWQFIDPRDIASAVRLALLAPELGCEVFYLLGHPDGDMHADVRHTRDFLGWKPRHTFEKYPRDGEVPGT